VREIQGDKFKENYVTRIDVVLLHVDLGWHRAVMGTERCADKFDER